jgi:hypothetical protein
MVALIHLLPAGLVGCCVLGSAFGGGCWWVVGDSTSKCWVAYAQLGFSILEVAVDPSYSNFFLGTYQNRLIWRQQLHRIATGCILILQAVCL